MALVGKIEAEAEINKSNAEEIFHVFGGKAHSMPDECAERIPKVELHEGEWGTEGTTRVRTYAAEGKAETCKEKLKIGEENKILSAVAVEGDVIKHYKTCKVTLEIVAKDKRSVAKFIIDLQ